MNGIHCEWVRDHLADHETGRLPRPEGLAVEDHLSRCDDCAAEREAIRLIARDAVALPGGLEDRVLRAVHAPRQQRGASFRLAVAASVVFALLAGGIVWKGGLAPGGTHGSTGGGDEVVSGELLAWPATEDPLLHGGISLHELSVDELEILLTELES